MSGLKTGPSTRGLQVFAIPAVCLLITFLGYFSQWLFSVSPDLVPGPLTSQQSILLNTLLVCVWYTYYKACTVDPGRYPRPNSATSDSAPASSTSSPSKPKAKGEKPNPSRWCKKCQAPKPLRAHHCRHCARCIPKMDHHCPWTGNCVSMQTFPYFLRFLIYTNLALWTLGYFLFQRFSAVWSDRHLPAYLGPSLTQLVSLTLIALICSGTSFALGILLFTTLKGWALNSTMIEDWEIERHSSVLSRLGSSSSHDSDFWGADGNSGVLIQHLNRIEFPYDIGIFSNMAQAMGTANPLLWFFPLAGGPVINPATPGKGPGFEWEENDFNDLPGMWPPPDPEKLRRAQSGWPGAASRVAAYESDYYAKQQYETAEDVKAAFAQRQMADLQRRRHAQTRQQSGSNNIIAELEEVDGEWEGPPAWTNSEGERLWDYGVDEEVERDDLGDKHQLGPLVSLREEGEGEDDDVPIAELIRRRRVLTREEDG